MNLAHDMEGLSSYPLTGVTLLISRALCLHGNPVLPAFLGYRAVRHFSWLQCLQEKRDQGTGNWYLAMSQASTDHKPNITWWGSVTSLWFLRLAGSLVPPAPLHFWHLVMHIMSPESLNDPKGPVISP